MSTVQRDPAGLRPGPIPFPSSPITDVVKHPVQHLIPAFIVSVSFSPAIMLRQFARRVRSAGMARLSLIDPIDLQVVGQRLEIRRAASTQVRKLSHGEVESLIPTMRDLSLAHNDKGVPICTCTRLTSVTVAMSGGVDSAVTLRLLLEYVSVQVYDLAHAEP